MPSQTLNPNPRTSNSGPVLHSFEMAAWLSGGEVVRSVRCVWQIVNRDLSIAVLRSFVEARREESEHEGPGKSKKGSAKPQPRSSTARIPSQSSSGSATSAQGVAEPSSRGGATVAAPGDDRVRNGENTSTPDGTIEANANGTPPPLTAGAGSFKPLRILEVCGMACLSLHEQATNVRGTAAPQLAPHIPAKCGRSYCPTDKTFLVNCG